MVQAMKRIAIVNDGEHWFVRGIASSTQRTVPIDEMVYHCDENLGGPFDELVEAVLQARRILDENP
jgi:hypothetical protein